MLVYHVLRIVTLLAVAFSVFAQNTGRFSELTAKGIAYIDQGRFNDALNALEEVWERDQSDPKVAENLAMAYLYTDHDLAKATALAERAIQGGGKASFLVQHPHEKIGFVSGDIVDFCTGRLSVSRERLVFTSRDERHSFVIEKGQLREMKANHVYGSSRGMYHIRTVDKKNYNFRPRSWSEEEQQLMLQLVNEYIR
jgi:tetratricopeptide (TPR) repeat protein